MGIFAYRPNGRLYIVAIVLLVFLVSTFSTVYASNEGPPDPGEPTDSDNDGVPDYLDDCPNEYGPESNNGCPISSPTPPPTTPPPTTPPPTAPPPEPTPERLYIDTGNLECRRLYKASADLGEIKIKLLGYFFEIVTIQIPDTFALGVNYQYRITAYSENGNVHLVDIQYDSDGLNSHDVDIGFDLLWSLTEKRVDDIVIRNHDRSAIVEITGTGRYAYLNNNDIPVIGRLPLFYFEVECTHTIELLPGGSIGRIKTSDEVELHQQDMHGILVDIISLTNNTGATRSIAITEDGEVIPDTSVYQNDVLGNIITGQWVYGDWDGDGDKTPGVHSNGFFYYTNEFGSNNWRIITLGFAGKPVVAGRFDASRNHDCIGVITHNIHPDTGDKRFRLNYWCNLTYSPEPGQMPFQRLRTPLGDSNGFRGEYQFVAGDWDRDGIDTIAVYRDGRINYTNVTPAGGIAEYNQVLWNPPTNLTGTWHALFGTGDWDKDGIDGWGMLYSTGEFYYRNGPGTPATNYGSVQLGQPTWLWPDLDISAWSLNGS